MTQIISKKIIFLCNFTEYFNFLGLKLKIHKIFIHFQGLVCNFQI